LLTVTATRAVILHVDDLGMCHGANQAFLELAAERHVTCGSVMVPCPWFLEIAEAAAANPTLDLGVHLTLTSEWAHYRWAPITTRSTASGLVDPDGYFWRDVRSLSEHLVVEAAEQELRAQIERAIEAGIRPTHVDAHMAAAMLPDLLEVHVRLAQEYGLFPVLPRRISFAPDPVRYESVIALLDRQGLPVVDGIRGTLPVAADQVEAGYRRLIEELPSGVTHFALHCTEPGEIEPIAPQHAPWRVNEYRLFATGAVSRWCEANAVTPIGLRQFQDLW
jgi:chitin disaccharide deacetylase